jgi:hypothetical protein
MSIPNTFTTLNGFFKESYADKLGELIPDGVKLINKIKFLSKDKQPGNNFHSPVILGQEHGVTFGGSDEDYFNLNAPVAGVIRDATIKGSPMVLRSVLGYTAASRAAQGGSKAFMDATKFLVANMLRSMAKKLEIEMLYGQMGYGAAAGAFVGNVLTIATAEWAPGIWAGAEGMPIDIYDDVAGTTLRGSCTITAVSLENRTITVDVAPAGVIAGDVIFHKGAQGKEFAGVHKVLSQTSGTLFGINVSSYNLFKGNVYDAGAAAMSFPKINNAVARAVEKGLEGKLFALVHPRAWANMMTEAAALRMFDSSYSSAQMVQGSQTLKFFAQCGEIEIEPSIYVKEGYAFMISVDDWSRVGSSDITFKRPGQGEEFFRDMENSSGYELRAFTDQALFCLAPGRSVVVRNIVNS